MKIAVYTIAKNEEQFVSRWAQSCQDADYRIILDTGSTDGTVAAAEAEGVSVSVQTFSPWRFDVARNASLALVPEDADICIALDMDEVIQPGWRAHVEKAFAEGATRPRYQYTWSWVREGVPGLVYGGDKMHARHGYFWRHPVHEVITPAGVEKQVWCGAEIHHHPDHTKSRSQYLPLLEMAVEEDPTDDRNTYYLAREYFYNQRMDEAKGLFLRHLDLPKATWKPERAASMRWLFKITNDQEWLLKAAAECPNRREAWVELAQVAMKAQEWESCLRYATRALAIKERPLEYLSEAFAWGAAPHDLAALAAYKCGYFAEARHQGVKALCMDPYNSRLVDNLRWYEAA